jgi:hypothetical protein
MIDDRTHERLVFKYLLERWAAECPESVFAWFHDEGGTSWTYRDADRSANRAANALRGLGVAKGTNVAPGGGADPLLGSVRHHLHLRDLLVAAPSNRSRESTATTPMSRRRR